MRLLVPCLMIGALVWLISVLAQDQKQYQDRRLQQLRELTESNIKLMEHCRKDSSLWDCQVYLERIKRGE